MDKYIFGFLTIGLMAFVPWTILPLNRIVIIAVTLFLLYSGIVLGRGYSILLLSLSLCIPQLEKGGMVQFLPLNYAIYGSIFIIGIYKFFFEGIRNIATSRLAIFLLLVIASLISAFSFWSSYRLVVYEIINIILLFIFVYIAVNDKLSPNVTYLCIDILFVTTCIYTFLQFFLDICPYTDLYANYSMTIDSTIMLFPKGLLGNELILSVFLLLYQCLFLIRFSAKKQVFWPLFVFCLIFEVITLKRTTYIMGIILILMWIIMSNSVTRKAKLAFLGLVLLFGTCFILFMDEYVNNILYRFTEDDAGHRIGAFDTAFSLLANHPFGVGDEFMEVIRREHLADVSFDSNFGTMDNYFLMRLCQFGLLSIFVILFDFFFVLFGLFVDSKEKRYFYALLLLLRIGLSFSFNVHAFASFCLFFGLIFVLVFKEPVLCNPPQYDKF